jgi:hypothetical protein
MIMAHHEKIFTKKKSDYKHLRQRESPPNEKRFNASLLCLNDLITRCAHTAGPLERHTLHR